jgi:4-diphosphocytidyl-2-C-methyl-D-erythritol kinase
VILRALAPGKVNLCLFLGGVRSSDGRHELVTLLESVSLADELELSTLDRGADVVHCPGVDGPNLVVGALAELRACGWDAPPVRIDIRKRIPVAAGMAGGSADAAAALRLAAHLAPLPEGLVLAELAAGLGADVPSQLTPGLALGTGAGEIVEQTAALAPRAFVIVPLAGRRLSTADVYREADRLGLARSQPSLARVHGALVRALREPAELPRELLVNELEPAARSLCPEIDSALGALRNAGAWPVLVCGSGPTSVGVYWGADAPARAAQTAAALSARFTGTVDAVPVNAEFAGVVPAA